MRAGQARVITYAGIVALAVFAATTPSFRAHGEEPGAAAISRETSARSDALQPPLTLPPLVVTPIAGTDTTLISGRIRSTLYAALDSCAEMDFPQRARWKLAWSMADILEYRVDMSRELRVGDSFRVLAERVLDPATGVRVGRVLGLRFVLSRDTLTAFRFAPGLDSAAGNGTMRVRDASAGDYYDVHGRSLRAAFLRAPLEFRRIASGFGMRLHPILGIWRNHRGTDYAAAMGTPVRAIGDGVVTFASRRGGYGNMIEIRHPNGYLTRYGHLARFASGIRQGVRVAIGETIAYVGMTGLATGPHLHFEVLVGGVQRDPAVALRDRDTGKPVPPQARPEFERRLRDLEARLEAREFAAANGNGAGGFWLADGD